MLFYSSGCDYEDAPSADPNELYEQALTFIQERSFKQAKPLLEQSIKLYREQNKREQLSNAYLALLKTQIELCEFRSAFLTSKITAAILRKEGNYQGEVKLALLDALLYAALGMNKQAIEKYKTAYAITLAFDDKSASLETQLELANIQNICGDLEEALEIYKQMLTQAQMASDKKNIANALCGIGSIYTKQQRYSEAYNSLSQGLTVISKTSNPLITANLHFELGLLYSAQNNSIAALRDFREAINVLRRARIGKDFEAVILFYYANLFERNGKINEAKRFYNDALEIARALGDQISENYLLLFLVDCNFNSMDAEQQARNVDKLRQSYEQLAKKFHECGNVAGEGYIYNRLGMLYEKSGDLINARSFYLKAVALDQNTLSEYYIDKLHSPFLKALGITSLHSDWYERLSAVFAKLGSDEEALKTLELSRLKKLFVKFQTTDIALRNQKVSDKTKDVRAKIWKAKIIESEYSAKLSRRYAADKHSSKLSMLESKEIIALRSELESAKQIIKSESKQIVNEFQNYETLVMPSPIEISTIKKYMPHGTLAVAFLPVEDFLYIFAINKNQVEVRTSEIRRDSLFQLIAEYKKLMQDPMVYSGDAGEASIPSMMRFAVLSTQLYEYLFRPVDDLFEQNLLIVADDNFNNFPFHAIERQDKKGNVKYLIELMNVDYIPTLASLRYIRASTTRLNQIVAFGNPTGKNWAVDYELRDIRSFFKKASVMVGLESSWNNLKSIRADLLQLSTEFGVSTTDHPLGYIVLSDGLIVEQSTNVPFEKITELDAIPVILLSNNYGHDASISFEHAYLLHLNGTSDVFYNAWIADRKAAKFFSEFFFTHLSNRLAPGDAYRQALLNLIRIREVNHPRSWGQFFHFGVG